MSRVVLGYLDPGSGSVIVQVVLGGVAGIAVAFKLLRHRILRLFRRGAPDDTGTHAEESV